MTTIFATIGGSLVGLTIGLWLQGRAGASLGEMWTMIGFGFGIGLASMGMKRRR